MDYYLLHKRNYEKERPSISFELFFYTKDAKFNPTSLKYKDKEYGKVRIVAADKSYPFGTIVKIKNLWYFNEDVYAIVLDRGGAIGKNKRALFDLLFALEENANTFGVENATCEILRLGY